VARTIADLEAHARVEQADLAMALSLRPGFAAEERLAA
jgi:predicted ATPase with chaperone activity